jgi:hypothetical protein
MSKLICSKCNEPMEAGDEISTLVGYISPKGHDHNDNRRTKVYHCPEGHFKIVVKINKCHVCDWVGRSYEGTYLHVVEEWYD